MNCDIEQSLVEKGNYKKFVSLHKEVNSWKNVVGHDCPVCCHPLEKYGNHYKFGCCSAEAHSGECEQKVLEWLQLKGKCMNCVQPLGRQ